MRCLPTIIRGFEDDVLSSDMGPVKLENGSVVDGGKILIMLDQWNWESYWPRALNETHQPQDIWINKNRLSGFWGDTNTEIDGAL